MLLLELIALRHQLLALERKGTTRPRLNRFGRLFRVWLYDLWLGGLDKDCPEPRPACPPEAGKIVAFPWVGGLYHRYERLAA